MHFCTQFHTVSLLYFHFSLLWQEASAILMYDLVLGCIGEVNSSVVIFQILSYRQTIMRFRVSVFCGMHIYFILICQYILSIYYFQDEMLAKFVTDSHIRHHPSNVDADPSTLPVSRYSHFTHQLLC